MLTINDALEQLSAVPESHRHLPLYVWDGKSNLHAYIISLFDGDAPHGPDNPLAVDTEDWS